MALLRTGIPRADENVLRRTFFAVLLLVIVPLGTATGSEHVGEYELKGAFLYNFAKFIAWPPGVFEAREEFVICVLGSSEVASDLGEVMRGKRVSGRAIVVRRSSHPRDGADCHILFVTDASGFSVRQVPSAISRAGVLVVGEARGFAQGGGIIRFRHEGKRLRFEINKAAGEAAGLAISSHLLKLAHPVYE
jgi:hypothetical protein